MQSAELAMHQAQIQLIISVFFLLLLICVAKKKKPFSLNLLMCINAKISICRHRLGMLECCSSASGPLAGKIMLIVRKSEYINLKIVQFPVIVFVLVLCNCVKCQRQHKGAIVIFYFELYQYSMVINTLKRLKTPCW